MEETNIQPVQAEQPKGRYKIGIIASIVIAVIVLLFIARIMISNSTTNKASDMVQTFLFSQIGNSISGQSKINLTSLDEVQSKLNSDETFVSSQLNELKSSGKILASVPNRTMVCGDGTIIGPEGAYNGAQCNFSTGQVTSSGSGFVSVNSNGSKAVIEIWKYSSLLTLERSSSYVLQLNNEEPKNLENILAQTLDEIL